MNTRGMHPGFSSGLSNTIEREMDDYRSVNPGTGNCPGAATFWTGVVMDDHDPLMEFRVWVQLAGYGAPNLEGLSEVPSWKGTAPDNQQDGTAQNPALRFGWTLCSPLMAYFGSDSNRSDFVIDGRNSFAGDVNSYGDFVQPRIGDQVGVIMMNGDPARAYWFGCIPKQNQSGMVPGVPGVARTQIEPGSPPRERTKDGAVLPGYDVVGKPAPPFEAVPGSDDERRDSAALDVSVGHVGIDTREEDTPGDEQFVNSTDRVGASGTEINRKGIPEGTGADPDKPERFPVMGAGRHTVVSGHAYDKHRGAGTSSARRESPSYVTGRKTPGWNFDSEQHNKNIDGSRFRDAPGRYRTKNTVGHSFVMDDHPDHQMIRLRTSSGNQILFNDSCSQPYIYLSTAKGNVWIEMVDDGDLNVFAAGSISFHAGKDMNFTADRDINIESGNNFNVFTHKDMRFTSGAEVHMSVQKDMRVLNQGNLDWIVSGNHHEMVFGADHKIVAGPMLLQIGGDYSECISGKYASQVGGTRILESSALTSIEALQIHLNSGIVTSDLMHPSAAIGPKFPELTKKDSPPGSDNVALNTSPGKERYLATVVPQHQPWGGRCGKDTAGTRGRVTNTANPNARTSPLDTAGGYTPQRAPGSASGTYRNGAANPSATKPDTVVGPKVLDLNVPDYYGMTDDELEEWGFVNASPPERMGIWNPPVNYRSDDPGEQPDLALTRYMKPGEYGPANSYFTSAEMLDFIKKSAGYFQFVEVTDVDSLMIGHGHEIRVNETVGGVTFTPEIYRNYVRTGAQTSMLTLSLNDADTLLKTDVGATEAYLRNNVTADLTQRQWDALVSFAFHMGLDSMENGSGGGVIRTINNGRFDLAAQMMSNNVYVDGMVDANVVQQRREERAIFFTEPNDGMTYTDAPDRSSWLRVGDFLVEPNVLDAIDRACERYNITKTFMYAMAGQESGFDKNATGPNGGKGLYQFTTEIAALYGISGQEYDPYMNADAACRYARDAKDRFLSDNGREANATDLYLMFFLGHSAGAFFAEQTRLNPLGIASATVDSVARGVSESAKVIFESQAGPRTNLQVYNFFERTIDARMSGF